MKQRLLIIWLPIILASTILVLAIYAVVQQDLRQSANDPQIQIAEDLSRTLSSTESTSTWDSLLNKNSKNSVDFSISLSPFTIVYDRDGNIINSTGNIHGAVPVIPAGVLDYAETQDDHRLTWQPAPNTRIAAVVKYFNGKQSGYVLAGRSLREVENREISLELILGAVWLGIILITLFVVLGQYFVEAKDRSQQ